MIETSKSDEIRDFLEFMGRLLGPDAVRDRSGSSAEDIAGFAAVARFPLPPLYVGYLREFGEKDRVLRMADDNDSRVRALLQFYEEQQSATPSEIPPKAVVIGAYGLSGERVLLYPADAGDSDATVAVEPVVAVSTIARVEYTCARNFRNHLYSQAVARGKILDGFVLSVRREDEAFLPEATEACRSLGFTSYWFSDEYVASLERDDGTVIQVVRTPSRTTVYGRFKTEAARNEARSFFFTRYHVADNLAGR
jgi:hypothetical protein